MWVFLLVFLLSRYFALKNKLKEICGEIKDRDEDMRRQRDIEEQELKMLQVQEQRIKNQIAIEKLNRDREKRQRDNEKHKVKLVKVAKEYPRALQDPNTWLSYNK